MGNGLCVLTNFFIVRNPRDSLAFSNTVRCVLRRAEWAFAGSSSVRRRCVQSPNATRTLKLKRRQFPLCASGSRRCRCRNGGHRCEAPCLCAAAPHGYDATPPALGVDRARAMSMPHTAWACNVSFSGLCNIRSRALIPAPFAHTAALQAAVKTKGDEVKSLKARD